MPTIITTPTWDTTFDLSSTTKKFSFTDTTDYVTAGIVLTGVRGVFEITTPSGVVIYNNTSYGAGSDIVANLSLDNAILIPLPNLANQAPEQGVYTITYTVQITDGTNPVYYITDTDTYDFTYTSPTVVIVPQVDCIQPLFTVTDDTDYVVNGITPTNSRTITLEYPANSGGTPFSNTTSATITTDEFYNGLQATTVQSILEYEYDTNFFIADTVEGTKSINVDCSYVCQLYCCLKSLNARKENARGVNNVLFEELEYQFSQVMGLLELLFLAIDCGKQEDANALITKIKTIAECTDDCSCTDGTPSRVQGLGIQNVNVSVVSGGAPISVTSATLGGITTYTISLSPSIVTQLTTMYNTVVSAGTGISVTDSGIISGVRTFTVNSSAAALKDAMWFKCLFEFTSASTMTLTISDTQIIGTDWVVATITNATAVGGNLLFKFDAFQTTPTSTYKVWVESIILERAIATVTYPAASQYLYIENFRSRVLDIKSNEFYTQIITASGIPSTIANVWNSGVRKISQNILIQK